MSCPICNGTGVMPLPHVPGSRGGWIDQNAIFSGIECGACNGTGVRPGAGGDDDRDNVAYDYTDPPASDTTDTTGSGNYSSDNYGSGDTGDASADPPSAEDQLDSARDDLVVALRCAESLPAEVTAGWRQDLPQLDVYAPERGHAILAGIRQEFAWAKDRYRPVRDVFSMSVTAEMAFAREMNQIERYIDYLDMLMTHAEAWLRDNPEYRRD